MAKTKSAPAEENNRSLKVGSLSPVGMMVFAAVMTLIAVPLRTYQLVNLVEPSTGFWLEKDLTVFILYGIIGLVIVLAFFISGLSGVMPGPKFPEKRSIPLGIVSLLMTVAFAYENVTLLMESMLTYQSYQATGTVVSTYSLMSSGVGPAFLESIFGLLAALYFMVLAISLFQGSGAYKRRRVLALNPVLWAIFRLIVQFVNPIRYQNVSQLLFELIYLVFTMIFFLSFARIASGVNETKSMWVLFFTGISGAFMAFVVALAPFALLITGNSAYICSDYPLEYTDLIIGFFITGVLLFNLPVRISNHLEEEDEVPDADAAEQEARAVAGVSE